MALDSPSLTPNQRLHHIVESYGLAGAAAERFNRVLVQWQQRYPWFLIELAVVEILAQTWLRLPRPTGMDFLKLVKHRLEQWHTAPITTLLSPGDLCAITGLDPDPIFHPTAPSSPPHSQPSPTHPQTTPSVPPSDHHHPRH